MVICYQCTCVVVFLSRGFVTCFRLYRVLEKDAMGQKNIHRGFSDPNMFAAQVMHDLQKNIL